MNIKKSGISLLAMAIMVSLAGCSLEGDDGATGPAGANGAAGTPGATGPTGAAGQNAQTGVNTQPIGRFTTGTYGQAAAEITQYHSASKRIFLINGAANRIEILNAATLTSTALSDALTANNLTSTPLAIPATAVVKNAAAVDETLTLGFANSIAISGNWLAIAVENKVKSAAGAVLIYDLTAATPVFNKAIKVGSLPDMLTFSPDGQTLIIANEGEPESNYSVDPEGSIGLVKRTNNQWPDQAVLLGFGAFESQKAVLLKKGLKIAAPEGTTLAQDIEPEYITVTADGKKAYVSLQDNNALAVVDIATAKIDKIVGLGFKDYSLPENALDTGDRDGINLQTVPGLFGVYQPDTITNYQWKGATFIVSANEGDSRDWSAYSEEARVSAMPRSAELVAKQAGVYSSNGLARLKVTKALGKNANGEYDALYAFGSRSFSIWDQNGAQVYDSAADFEKISAALQGEAGFNSNHLANGGDNRSDDKGPEPEAVAVGQVGDKTYAFVGTERLSAVFVYDVTNPYQVKFVDYFHNRNFDVTFAIDDEKSPPTLSGSYLQAGDLGPESLVFVPAAQSATGKALLLMASEVSGSLTVFEVSPKY
ncbi:alkaline phosphatase [Rheinheimera riviphila]|uniref:Alkaline phosphatase n=1 Tax=Rheinheimera riviphila TaxID=1834037 RepID=A0A437QMC3_9GAMM|nr:choice-of-anchor I family protein [Rheinheimera riviphila]RVU35665.1 alkaline phosphatase [Rheinheimera riviphila]